jgi:hypothetical protein
MDHNRDTDHHHKSVEHLTNQQIILLALLVSFVSSIATGIVTVSLVDQGSPAVTQTVNRIVERTIERVSSATTTPSIKETVIVRDDQAVVDAIAKVSKSLVRIIDVTGGNERLVGLGLILSPAGVIVANTQSLSKDTPLVALLDGGNKVSVMYAGTELASGLSIFRAEQSSDPKLARVYAAPAFAEADALKLGQSVIAITGLDNLSVATGIISSLERSSGTPATRVVHTSIADPIFASQSVLVNLVGQVVGLKSGDTIERGFTTSSVIKAYATP